MPISGGISKDCELLKRVGIQDSAVLEFAFAESSKVFGKANPEHKALKDLAKKVPAIAMKIHDKGVRISPSYP